MAYTCPQCQIELDTEPGLKRHMTRKHKSYSQDDLRSAGVTTPQGKDIARSLDGHTGIDSVIADAPDSETKTSEKKKRDNKEYQSALDEFRRARPLLLKRWERRLRIPYSLWAALANDPKIRLADKEAEDGAALHVDFCEAMGWFKAGKIEAIADLVLWHGATALSRSDIGQTLISKFSATQENINETQTS